MTSTTGLRIACLGDSLTQGTPGGAFLPLLAARMPQHEFLNRGRSGDSVADLLARMHHEGLDPVDIAVVWVGVNDAMMGSWDCDDPGNSVGDGGDQDAVAGSDWSWPRRLQRLCGDYEELLEWIAARAARLLCVEPLVLEAEGSLWEARAADVAAAVRELTAGMDARAAAVLAPAAVRPAADAAGRPTQCTALDLRPAFATAADASSGLFTIDGVHFTAAGAEVVAAAFAVAIDGLARGAA